jgi:hypothetical protein
MEKSVEKVGLADRWLNRKRGGRKKMKIEFDASMIFLLNGMVRSNGTLPLADASGDAKAPLAPYKADDDGAKRQLLALQKWMEKKLLVKRAPDPSKGEKGTKDIIDYPELEEDETIKVGINKTYVDRLKIMMKHYKKLGGLSSMVEPWLKLTDALDGTKFEVNDDVEEVEVEEKEEVAVVPEVLPAPVAAPQPETANA